jgi:tripartite-type tricarboxylate transporter receptor subunit TctC
MRCARGVLAGAIALGIGVAAAVSGAAHAQSYPARPIKLIVPFPAGGPVDVMARLLGQKLSANFGQVIVDNRPGGGSTIGVKAAASADPDGYTLLYSGPALSVLPALTKIFETDPIKSFAPIALVSSVPFVLIVAPQVPVTSVQELIAYAKANPGKLNFGAPTGATPQLVGELFKMKAGIDFVYIPYKGAATTITDMLTGQIDMAFEPTSVLLAHINDAKIRPLAITGTTRSPNLPTLPTMIESGVPGVVAASWTGVLAPAGTPTEILDKLNRAINEAVKSDDMVLAFKKLGAEGIGGSPQDFAAMLAVESPKWIEVVKTSGIKID